MKSGNLWAAMLVVTLLMSVTWCPAIVSAQSRDVWRQQRERMVEVSVKAAGVTDQRVLAAMRATPRHEFIPRQYRDRSYLDAGVPIGEQQTISSPFIVAFMTQTLEPLPTDKVLEIGTGSGYQAAVLSPLVKDVYSIEIVESLGKRAAKVLKSLDYKNVHTKIGDGYAGWEQHAPFDKIIVTCSPENVPTPLVDQLREGGRIVVPIGERHQQTLYLLEKVNGKLQKQSLRPTLFVPMTGKAEDKRKVLPDPERPALLNASFEEGTDKDDVDEQRDRVAVDSEAGSSGQGFVKGWYYQRQMILEESDDAPHGKFFVEFKNSVPGQHAHLMQRFSVDGGLVAGLRFATTFGCEDVKAGLYPDDLPVAALTFYDSQLREVGRTVTLGPFRGTWEWKRLTRDINVPIAARTAIVRIGLFGATGTARFDRVTVDRVQ